MISENATKQQILTENKFSDFLIKHQHIKNKLIISFKNNIKSVKNTLNIHNIKEHYCYSSDNLI